MKRTVYTVMAVVMAVSLSGSAVADLVAHWTFDTDFTDSVGSYDMAATNGASVVAGGKIGGAASFDRSLSQYAKTSASPFTVGGDYTVTAWYNVGIEDITSERLFVFESENYVVSYGLRDLGAGDVGQIYTNTTDTADTNTTFDPGANQSWNHIALTYQASSGTFNAYINGAFAGTMVNTGTPESNGYFVVGGHRSGTGRNFDGLIDDVAVFNNIVSTDYIEYLAAGNAVPEPATLSLLGLGCLGLLRRRK